MRVYLFRFISGIILSHFSEVYLSNVATSQHPVTEKSYSGTISRIVSLTTNKSKDRTVSTFWGDNKVPEYIVKPIEVFPRIVVDIFCVARLLGGMFKVIENSNVKLIRVRYYSPKIGIVFDITGSVVLSFSDKSVGNELITTLKSKEIEDKNRTESITNVDKQTKDITIMTLS